MQVWRGCHTSSPWLIRKQIPVANSSSPACKRPAGTASRIRLPSSEARQILDELLEKYAEHGAAQFVLPDVLKVPPVSEHGQVGDIIKVFGGADKLRAAVTELQTLLYAA